MGQSATFPSGASAVCGLKHLRRLPEEVHTAYVEELGVSERSALLSWLGFTGTFSVARGITHSIRSGRGPFHNVSTGGIHLHHYLWGIAMLTGVGAIAVHGEDERRRHPSVALTYGVGLGLIIDEFALLVDLEDVYWSRSGRISVEVGTGLMALGGTVLAGLPVLQRLARNRRQRHQRAGRSAAGTGTSAGPTTRTS